MITLGCLLSALVNLTPVKTTLAQTQTNPTDLIVSPPVSYLTVEPGSTTQHLISIEQKGHEALLVIPLVVRFNPDGQSGTPILGENSNAQLPSYTFQLPNPIIQSDAPLPFVSQESQSGQPAQSRQGFILEPFQRRNVGVTFTIPEQSLEHEFPLTVLFFTQPVDVNSFKEGDASQPVTSHARVTSSVGSNVILMVSRTDRDRGKLSVAEITLPRLLDSFSSLNFTVLAKNSGLNATAASGSATITNWQGTKVAQFEFFPDMVLSNSTRLLRHVRQDLEKSSQTLNNTTNPDGTNFDPDRISPIFTYKPFFLLGPYTITATIFENAQASNDQSGQALETIDNQVQLDQHSLSITVNALPYSAALIFGVLSLGVIGILVYKNVVQNQ